MTRTSVFIVDDHQLIRKGLHALLDASDRFVVCGEAGSGEDALAQLRYTPTDIVLLDIGMPGLGGIDVARTLLAQPYPPRILLLTMHNSSAYVETALRIGVSGFLLKDAGPQELLAALDAIRLGQTYLSPAISGNIIRGFQSNVGNEPSLTARQIDILKRVALGQSTKEIAQQLNLSVKTVETHRSQIMTRLDIHEVTGLVRYAIRHRLIEC